MTICVCLRARRLHLVSDQNWLGVWQLCGLLLCAKDVAQCAKLKNFFSKQQQLWYRWQVQQCLMAVQGFSEVI